MPAGDLELVRCRVAAEPDDFHTVEERLRDRVNRVRRADKHDVAQIVGNVHVVIRKGVVLLGVKDFKQGAGGISVVGDAELVHFVQYHDGVGDAALFNAVHDPAGHRADVGPAVAADVSFVAHAAKAHTHIFPVQSLCDALSDTGLAGARSADEQKDRARLLLFEIHDGDLLDDALLHFFESEMIFLQNGFGFGQIDCLRLLLLPGQTCDKIQIVVQHSRFGSAVRLLFETVKDLQGLALRGLVHTGLFDLDLELADVRHLFGMHFVEFPLQQLHLLLDRGFLVDLLIILLLCAGSLSGHLGDLHELVDCLLEHLKTLFMAVLRQNLVFLLRAHFEPDGHGHGNFTDGVELVEIAHSLLSPLKPLPALLQVGLELLKMSLLYAPVQIFDLLAAGNSQLNSMIWVHPDHIEVDSSCGADLHIAFLVHFFDKAGNADRIEAVLGHILAVLLLLAGQKHYAVVDLRVSSGQMPVLVRLQIYVGVRNH